jgi:hypothetical protein
MIVETKQFEPQSNGIDCFGTLGVMTLIATKYLLVITEAQFVGKIHLSYIYRVDKVAFMPYARSSVLAANVNKAKDDLYIEMV